MLTNGRPQTVGSLIQYFCVRPEHAEVAASEADQLTIHEGHWAFCPRNALSNEHAWEPTGGITLIEIEQFARSRGVPMKRETAPTMRSQAKR